MSNRYKGGVISATPPTTTGGNDGVASGAWTLEQQMQAQAAGLWPNQPIFYIEDVFSTYLYTGNGTSQTITNGVNLLGKGGLVWIKSRMTYDASGTVTNHNLITDPAAGRLQSNTTAALGGSGGPGFTSTGFQVSGTVLNSATEDGTLLPNKYVSWSFRKQAKFFDIVTYTGNNAASRNISHNLGSTPGCIIWKPTNITENWPVYHRSTGANGLYLNGTNSAGVTGIPTGHTSTTFEVTYPGLNDSGVDYVAYLFAHDAGGFGLTGTDNVISCGSYTGNGSSTGPEVSIGYEPQWLLIKQTSSSGNSWSLYDNMRGLSVAGPSGHLRPNDSAAEDTTTIDMRPTATGFQPINSTGRVNASGSTYIYIAIRRGPMRVPTSGTSVYNAVSRTGTGSAATITGIGFAPDLLDNQRTTAGSYTGFFDRLRGGGTLLYRALDDPDTTVTGQTTQFNTTMDGFAVGTSTASDSGNNNTVPYIWHCYKRAPSVFDIVCYTGNGTTQNVSHNLGVAPELMIVKGRNATGYDWQTYASPIGNTSRLLLNSTGALASGQPTWNYTTPTSSVFSVGSNSVNNSGTTFVAYLFATCAGVSKVGSYTGTGALQTVNCGFTTGARFVLIKRTDSTGDWYVYDSVRGISSGNDPYLLWNTTGAEVTGTNYVDTDTTGFQVTAAAPSGLNASGGTYIFLAIA